jgi:hypothetical protein
MRPSVLTKEFLLKRCSEAVDGCLEWLGGKTTRGYPLVNSQGKVVYAHREMMRICLSLDRLPSGILVCHKCDNPSCINPEHLFLGTQADNMRDMSVKGRCGHITHPDRVLRGTRHGMAKLTASDVREIRSRCGNGEKQREVAEDYSITQAAVSLIVRRINWRHIP